MAAATSTGSAARTNWHVAVVAAAQLALLVAALCLATAPGRAEGSLRRNPFIETAMADQAAEGHVARRLHYGNPSPPPPPPGCDANRQLCSGAACRHMGKPSCCSNKCVDLFASINNCGRCGHRCYWGFSCCKGSCCDLNTDSSNCGSVGHKCPKGVPCQYGMCGYGDE